MARMMIFVTLVMAMLVNGGMAIAASPAAPLSTPELQQAINAGKKNTVVFFQNPQGGPCRAQKEVLDKLHKDRKGSFNIVNVSTMKQEDQRAFYEYGVRNLPSLVLVDKGGKINRVFPPGIQTYEALAAALDGIK
jgi:thioredoxin-like negative regulator of GroEL